MSQGMSLINFQWKNYRDSAGVETATRLILLFTYNVFKYPKKNFGKNEYSNDFNIYKANIAKCFNFKLLERSPLWNDSIEKALRQYYFDEEVDENSGETLKDFFIKEFVDNTKIQKKVFREERKVFIEWGLLVALINFIFNLIIIIKAKSISGVSSSTWLYIGAFWFVSFLMIGTSIFDLIYTRKINKLRKIIRLFNADLFFQKLNEEMDFMSSYFTEEAVNRQIAELERNDTFKDLKNASEEFGELVKYCIRKDYFLFGKDIITFTKNFPKYCIVNLLREEDFFTDYKGAGFPFYVEMKHELDILFNCDTSKAGKNNLTESKSAWNPNVKNLGNKMRKAMEQIRKEMLVEK